MRVLIPAFESKHLVPLSRRPSLATPFPLNPDHHVLSASASGQGCSDDLPTRLEVGRHPVRFRPVTEFKVGALWRLGRNCHPFLFKSKRSMLLLANTVAVSKLATTPKRCRPQGVCLFGMGVLHCVLWQPLTALPPWAPLILCLYRVG